MKRKTIIPMKTLSTAILVAGTFFLFSCGGNSSSSDKKKSDSAYTGLEGTREEASQLSNSTIDTSSGKSGKETMPVDSTAKGKKDSVSNR